MRWIHSEPHLVSKEQQYDYMIKIRFCLFLPKNYIKGLPLLPIPGVIKNMNKFVTCY